MYKHTHKPLFGYKSESFIVSNVCSFRLCMDEERHKNMICEMDQGGPVIQQVTESFGVGLNVRITE